jgi:hypothetical protein
LRSERGSGDELICACCRLAKPAVVCARKSAEHPHITVFDFGENFIHARERSRDKPGHVGDLTAQKRYILLALFKPGIEIAHPPLPDFVQELLKQLTQV